MEWGLKQIEKAEKQKEKWNGEIRRNLDLTERILPLLLEEVKFLRRKMTPAQQKPDAEEVAVLRYQASALVTSTELLALAAGNYPGLLDKLEKLY